MAAPAQGVAGLQHRLRLQQPQTSTGEYNSTTIAYVEVGVVWCDRTDVGVLEAWRAREVAAELDTTFKVRWSTLSRQVRATWRVALEDGDEVLTYEVVGVREIVHNRWLEIQCVRRSES